MEHYSLEESQTTDPCNDFNESQRNAVWKKPDTEYFILYDLICMTVSKRQNYTDREQIMVTRVSGERVVWLKRSSMEKFSGDETVLWSPWSHNQSKLDFSNTQINKEMSPFLESLERNVALSTLRF